MPRFLVFADIEIISHLFNQDWPEQRSIVKEQISCINTVIRSYKNRELAERLKKTVMKGHKCHGIA